MDFESFRKQQKFSATSILPTLKSAMENGSLFQVLLNKDFFQYGCNRVHLSSSSYVVMVARIVTQKRQGLAPTSFFISSPLSLFVVQGISRYHTIWDLLFKAKAISGSKSLFFLQKKPTTTYFFVPDQLGEVVFFHFAL